MSAKRRSGPEGANSESSQVTKNLHKREKFYQYRLLLLEESLPDQSTYKRVGVGIATWERLRDEAERGIPIHLLGKKKKIVLV